jgi:hypothetical protein
MSPLLKFASLLIVPIAKLIWNAIEDARDERIEKRRSRAITEAKARELEAQRQDELRRQERKRIRQTRGGSTPVPIPGYSDAETPAPVSYRDEDEG